ncbi:MAG: hypothetical protein HGB23_09625 [Chlorobiaceae bacterium]|nr:hypothetical protein [Chlorobiaceae bacterium]
MTEHLISIKDFAEQQGLYRQTVFKVIKRLEIEPAKLRGGKQNRGQTISYITEEDAQRLLEALASSRRTQDGKEGRDFSDAVLYDVGVCYLLCLEPVHDPCRFKVGFASNLPDRLRQHRCSAPFTQIVKTWPCRRLWEKTAIECVTEGCERLHTEIFRSQSLDAVESKCEQFFALMPQLSGCSSD